MTVLLHTDREVLRLSPKKPMPLRTLLADADLAMPESPCGGRGTCRKCGVWTRGAVEGIPIGGKPCDPSVPPPKDRAVSPTEDAVFRLSCRCLITGDCEIWLPPRRVIEAETGRPVSSASQTDSSDPTPAVSSTEPAFGIAVDLGTTTVVVYLCDLTKGKILSVGAFGNPQRCYGADVMNRIGAVTEHGIEALRDPIRKAIGEEIVSLCRKNGISIMSVQRIVVAGNTVMEHLIAGYDPSGMGGAPFTPFSLFGFSLPAESLSLPAAPDAEVYLMPCFSAFVGGDIASGLIETNITKKNEPALFLDIGTNGEMAVWDENRLFLCSTAAGPALEGAKISCGVPGIPGAICRVTPLREPIVNKADHPGAETIGIETIGGLPPCGICGSGVIDAVASLLSLGQIDESGYMEAPFPLVPDENLSFTPSDVREVQLAKAAIAAGVLTLLDEAHLKPEELSVVYLAGGFGAHLDRASVCRIGLLPKELEQKIRAVGNTSGLGAVSYLLSEETRNEIASVRERAETVDLATRADFVERYCRQMSFGDEEL